MSKAILEIYRDRTEMFGHREDRFGACSTFLGTVSRICNWCCAGCLLLGWLNASSLGPWLVAGASLLAVSLGMVVAQSRCLSERDRFRELRRINQDAVARIRRNWKQVPLAAADLSDEETVIAEDLDLFGHASLFHLICMAKTKAGIQTLRNWLLSPARPAEITRRQQAVAELAPQLEFRQEVNSLCRMLADTQFAEDDFFEWVEGGTYLSRRPWMKWLVRILPLVTVTMPALVLANVLPQEIGMPIMMAAMAANFVITVLFAGKVHDIFSTVCPGRDGLSLTRSERLFAVLSTVEGDSQQITDIKHNTREAHRQLQQLKRIMQPASISRNPWTAIFVYVPLQFIFLWDFHILALLELWQQRCRTSFRRWFATLGRYEAIESLASLAHDNPHWAFPDVDDEHVPEFNAESLGHPLLPEAARITNDVSIGPAGTMLLVTGSNMSGKSTLLRAIGTNAVLAQAGSPVCAKRLRMPPLTIATSMRIADSLKDGVSLFMAEVLRLKRIVDMARRFTRESQQTMLFLLDEILHGTNTAERHIAIRRVLTHLLGQHVIGAVTTHDLDLAEEPALTDSCQVIHFRESLHKQDDELRMTFDYKIRSGVAPTTNALKLLDMVGLEPC